MKNRITDSEGDLDFASRDDIDAYHDLALKKMLWLNRRDGEVMAHGDKPSSPWSSSEIRQRFRALPLQDGTVRIDFSDTAVDNLAIKSSAAGSSIVYATSGSTGSPKVLLDSYAEVLHNSLFHGKGYRACGIRPSDRVVLLGEVGRFAGEYAVLHALSGTGCMIIPFVDRTKIEGNIALMHDMGANVWLAMQSEMFPYLVAFQNAARKVPPLRLVVTGGEAISTGTSKRLRAIFGNDLQIRSTFQTSDAGTIGYQCPWCETDEYHIHEELQFVEILDEYGVETSGPGRLVLTNLIRTFLPTIRFQTGDYAQWAVEAGTCPCRRTARKLRLIGRCDRIVTVGSAKIEISAFESIRDIASQAGLLCQIVLSHNSSGTTTVSIHSDVPLPESMRGQILHALAQLNAYADAYRDGSVKGPTFHTGFSSDTDYRGFSKFIPVIETFQ